MANPDRRDGQVGWAVTPMGSSLGRDLQPVPDPVYCQLATHKHTWQTLLLQGRGRLLQGGKLGGDGGGALRGQAGSHEHEALQHKNNQP